MHIPKLLVFVCLSSLGVSSLFAQRADSDVQAQAREQLRKAMAQFDTNSPASASSAAPAMPAAPVTPAAPKPTPAQTSQPAMTAPTMPMAQTTPPAMTNAAPGMPQEISPADQERALEALHKAMRDAQAQEVQVPPTNAAPPPPAKPVVVTPKPPVTPPMTMKTNAVVAMTNMPPAKPSMPAMTTTPPVKPAAPVVVTKPPTGPAWPTNVAPQTPGKPVVTPATTMPATVATVPAPLTGTKAERLSQLLEQYKADQITPSQYHDMRAKILAEPDK